MPQPSSPIRPWRRLAIAATLALLLPAGQASAQQALPFAFGLWGDMPYEKSGDRPKMPALLGSINASDIDFSIYDGDIKDGSSKCTDDVFVDALGMFAKLRKPVFYVPGDNEWTDCHRLNNGGYDNLERLAHLRRVMFATTGSLGQERLPAEHQGAIGAKFVENIRFVHKGIAFVGLNVPGSNNNKVLDEKDCTRKSARTLAQCAAGNAEYEERDAANIAWLRESFAMARARNAPGLVIVIQGDPGFDLPETEDVDESKAPEVSGYRAFMAAVAEETERFAGQVLFVHGDTHFFKVDMPLHAPDRLLANFTRVQTFGSPSIHWVRVAVDPASPRIFQVSPVIVKQ